MKAAGKAASLFTVSAILSIFFAVPSYGASDAPTNDIVVKARPNIKLQPVIFSHATHVEKQKINCATCHHKDAAKPAACTTCHKTDAQDKIPSSKEAFHGKCRTCHKEQVAIKCHDCHHKPEPGK